jgi:cytochrome o ubiquinol oxidase subunit I
MHDKVFGNLTWHAFIHEAVQNITNIFIIVGGLVIIFILFYFKKWRWLWREWITSVDPKRIGVMYIVVVLLQLIKGLGDAALMRAQQDLSVGASHGYLSADHFQQIFSAHGTTMIFFVGMGIVFGTMNLLVPLQIGARDVAYPFMNALSFWLFAAAGTLIFISLLIGRFQIAGWLAYPPLSELEYSPDEGVDYWIWLLQIAGVSSLLSGINFTATIFKMRCPGMTLWKMPIFIWSALGTLVLVIFAFPIITVTLSLLALDRYMGMHFFTSDFGGNPMMYVNLIWAWGHPEVYVLILPAFGIFSEVVATFSQKRLFGYLSMVWAIAIITFLSFIVWLHHFFTMGAGPNVNAFFGIMTMLIAVPTGVKMYNWLFTQYRGRVLFHTPMYWFTGFACIFAIGGMAGVQLSIPPVDFQVHNSLFLIAHFHSVIIGGLLFGFFAGYVYWFPKFTGFKLNERIGKYAFYFWLLGFLLAFMPLYLLGFMGATRRLDHYGADLGWRTFFIVASIGVALVLTGLALVLVQLVVSIRQRKENRDLTGDPWNGRTLEWSIPSPPPIYNFAVMPRVGEIDAFWHQKQLAASEPKKKVHYEDLRIPSNTVIPFFMGVSALIFGFAMTWRIYWLAAVGFAGILIFLIYRLSQDETHYILSAAEVEKIEALHRKQPA